MIYHRKKILTAFVAVAIFGQQALASGYHFGTQSVSVQSTSNASSAEAADPSTIFYNAAGLTKLPGTQISGNLIVALPNVEYSNAEGYYYNGVNGVNGTAVSGLSSGTLADSVSLVPHLYASHQINDRLTAGLGIYAPFGSSSEYESTSAMRYSITSTEITAIDINPTIAFDFQNGHSVAVGVIGQYLDAGLTKHVDFSIPFISAGLAVPVGSADVIADVAGDDWGFGYNLAWMWDINENARIGLNYRSKVEHTLEGEAQWNLDGAAFANTTLAGIVRSRGYVASEGADLDLVTPESLSLHGMYRATPQWDLFGDITWTRHSRFNTLNINYENAKTTTSSANTGTTSSVSVFAPRWKDTYRFSLGAAYQYSDPLQLRFGVSYDQSPVDNPDDRLATLPDNDRIWLSLGAKYDFNENSSLNLGYSYIHIKDASVNTSGYCGTDIKVSTGGASHCVSDRGNASADYDSNAHFIGLQYTYRF